MANTLTGLIPVIYKALDTVVHELVGFIPSVYINADASGAAKDQTIRYPVVPAVTAADIVPAATAPVTGVQTIAYKDMTIDKSRSITFLWNGEEERSLGTLTPSIQQDQWTQAFRAITNEVETDLAVAAKQGSSRAYGTAGTAPFGTANDLTDIAQIMKILLDNGAPMSDLHLVFNTIASANLRGKQSLLFKVNEAGTSDLLRMGRLGMLEGFSLHESAQLATHTKGTGAGYLTNEPVDGFAVGEYALTVDTGTGTVLAGDVVTFTGDTNKYVVTSALSGGNVSIGRPGVRQTLADNVAMTVVANYTPNMAFCRDAIHLVTRTPLMPAGGDAATDSMVVTDPFSGLSFLVCRYAQYHQSVVEIGLAWGKHVVKNEFVATLLS